MITYYGSINVLKGIDLEVKGKEIVCLLGGNGAGKTTTMKTIMGLVKPAAGEICFQGKKISGKTASQITAVGIAIVPEARRIFPRLSVLENLEIGTYVREKTRSTLSKSELASQVEEDLARVYQLFPRLKERRSQAGGTLSGGEQQMLAIGRALMFRPALILMDEPSMGLSPNLVDQIFEIILEINKSGASVFMVEQNASMALSIAHRAYVLQTGRIVASGTGRELLNSEEIRSAYLGG
ncbi:MAG: ABC transporter ATP-binding protein [bacterium]